MILGNIWPGAMRGLEHEVESGSDIPSREPFSSIARGLYLAREGDQGPLSVTLLTRLTRPTRA